MTTQNFKNEKDIPVSHQDFPGTERDMPNPQATRDELPEAGGNSRTYQGSGKLKGKRALITGGDSGIGAASALLFGREGTSDIVIAYLPEEEKDAQDTKKQVEGEGAKVHLISLDLSKQENCRKLVDFAVEKMKGIDILFNNAAYQMVVKDIKDLPEEQWIHTFNINIHSFFYVSKYALPHMKEGATIINNASINAYIGRPDLLDYTSTKGAIVSFTRGLSNQYVSKGIRVNAVAPGPVWTPLIPATMDDEAQKNFTAPMGRPAQPSEIATCIVFLASSDSSCVSGQTIHCNGGTICLLNLHSLVMRLINTQTLQLEFYHGGSRRYAILSHVWGNDEVTFQDMTSVDPAEALELDRYSKLRESCKLARSLKMDYLWIDTCCIDKSSSAELSEAINSMFRWYAESTICLAFLQDVPPSESEEEKKRAFRGSRWFSRGWTLQELIAPGKVIFYGQDWKPLGNRSELKDYIKLVTGISEELLDSTHHMMEIKQRQLGQYSIAEKMYWAAGRETTRPEDIAYCLLGIFDINMPLLYGEGQIKAFKRLQEEIIKSTDDESIYAWRQPRYRVEGKTYWSLLANSPSAFDIDHVAKDLNGLVPKKSKYLSLRSGVSTSMTNRGLELELSLTPFPIDKSGSIFLAFLNCEFRQGQTSINPAILLQRAAWDKDSHFVRIRPDILALSMMNSIILPDELLNMMRGGQTLILKEAIPRQIFVPHNTPDLRYLKGVIFRPEIKGLKDESKIIVRVRSRSPTWQYFVDTRQGPSQTAESYEINFDLAPGPSLGSLQEPIVLGVLELDLGSADSKQCLVMGLEPLLPNPFQTTPLYFLPWYAFEEQAWIARQDFTRVLDKPQRRLEWRVLDMIRATIGIESRYSSLFYSLTLEIDSKRKTNSWFQ
ncbi:unnamed protein product [Fusarium graminearum]|uniref:Uncharacterized protein n=1 Tax=Gibberella zeae TaxID=5518 RepID=A0A4E9DRW7_GIBZA|nr:unnamed protein product [Fusarium graminearum]CAG2004475.1 unnamed protein product [Fusarium graminearum]